MNHPHSDETHLGSTENPKNARSLFQLPGREGSFVGECMSVCSECIGMPIGLNGKSLSTLYGTQVFERKVLWRLEPRFESVNHLLSILFEYFRGSCKENKNADAELKDKLR